MKTLTIKPVERPVGLLSAKKQPMSTIPTLGYSKNKIVPVFWKYRARRG